MTITHAHVSLIPADSSDITTDSWNAAHTISSGLALTQPVFTGYAESVSAISISSNVLTVDLSTATVFTFTNSANISTFTISNATAAKANSFTLILTANGSGFTQTWGASVKWAGGSAPTLTTTNAKVDILTFITPNGGTTWYAFVGGQNF